MCELLFGPLLCTSVGDLMSCGALIDKDVLHDIQELHMIELDSELLLKLAAQGISR